MICPACKKDMFVVEYKQVELDYCHSCHGAWFDAGELELLLESGGIDGSKPFLSDLLKSPEARTSESKRRCPTCSRKMKKVKIGGEAGVMIDACHHGDGLWFDGGEVVALVKIITATLPEKKGSESEIMGFLKDVFKA